MIYYYSATKKTQVYAEVLAQILDSPIYVLETNWDNGQSSKFKQFGFFVGCAFYALVGKTIPVKNMPKIYEPHESKEITKETQKNQESEIYVCAPIWANAPAPPIEYFLKNAIFKNVKVHLLLTASAPNEKMRTKGQKLLSTIDCIPGNVFVFAGSGAHDIELLKEQLKEMVQ